MNKYQKIVLPLLVTALAVNIVGCSSNKSSQKMTAEKTKSTVLSQEAKSIKDDLLTKLSSYQQQYKAAKANPGYLLPEQYGKFESDLNVIALAVNSPTLKMNDDKEIEKILASTQEKIQSLSDEELNQAKANMHSGAIIYAAAFMGDIHILLDEGNISNSTNALAQVMNNNSGSDMGKVAQDAKKSIETWNTIYQPRLNTVVANLQTYDSSLPESDKNAITNAVTNLKSSLDKQIRILQQLDGSAAQKEDVNTLLNELKKEYNQAKQQVEQMETSWKIEYTEGS